MVVPTMFLGDVYSNRSKLVERSKGPRGSNGGKISLLSQAAALLPGGRSYFHFNPQLLIDLSGGGGEEGTRPIQRMRSVGAGDLRCFVRGLGWFSAKSRPEEL